MHLKLILYNLLFVNITISVQVQMPSAEIIHQRLINNKLRHFSEKTNIANNLAGKKLEAKSLSLEVDLVLYDYIISNFANNDTQPNSPASPIVSIVSESRADILKALLEDYPEELGITEIT